MVVAGLFVFGFFEYFRSWKFYSRSEKSFTGFVVNRFVGYYATSFNNGALCMSENKPYLLPLPYHTLHSFWNNPLTASIASYKSITGIEEYEFFMAYLKVNGNPEYNLPCGLLFPIMDYGIVPGCLVWILVGYWIGLFYQQFLVGRMLGLMMYPMLWFCLLDTPRETMLFAGRSLPSYLLVVIAWVVLRTISRSPVLLHLFNKTARSVQPSCAVTTLAVRA